MTRGSQSSASQARLRAEGAPQPRLRGKDLEAPRRCTPQESLCGHLAGDAWCWEQASWTHHLPTQKPPPPASHCGPGPSPLPAPDPHSHLLLASGPAHTAPPGTPCWPTSQPLWAPGHVQSCSLAWETPGLHSPPPLPSSHHCGCSRPGHDLHASSIHISSPDPKGHCLSSLRVGCPSCLHVANSYSSFKTLFK